MIRRLLKIWLGVLLWSMGVAWALFLLIELVVVLTQNGDIFGASLAWILVSFMGSSYMALATVTMLLNCIKKVRDNKWLRFLSFYLVPVSMIFWPEVGLLISVAYLPYLVVLTAAYIRFLRKYKSWETTK